MKIPRFVLILGTVLLILFLMQIYTVESFIRSLNAWDLSAVSRNWIIGAVIFLVVFLDSCIFVRLFFRFIARSDSSLLKNLVIVPSSVWLISSVLFFVSALLKEFGLWLWQIIPHTATPAEEFQIGQAAGLVSAGFPVLMTGYGVLKTARDYKVHRVEISSPKLPSALDGFTIAQISDIHSGMFMHEREMRNILEILNSLHPQIAALTGDFVDSRADEITPVAKVFSKIKTDYGIYGCMGNHDVFDNYEKLSAAMRESGIVMLDNDHRTLKVDGDSLNVLGVGDSGRRNSHARIEKALRGVDPDSFKVLLAHRPSFFPTSVKAGIDLQLSGHTHGGQVGLKIGPIQLNPVYLFYRYVQGHYTAAGSQLYVNPGVGMVFAPMRLSVRPEITLITLRSRRAAGGTAYSRG